MQRTVPPTATDTQNEERTSSAGRRIDVSNLDAAGVDAFVRNNIDTDDVSLEHRGARTYLVVRR